MKCTYRRGIDCRFTRREPMPCQLCLMGQLIESTELNTSTIMERSMDKLDAEVIPMSDRLKEALDEARQ